MYGKRGDRRTNPSNSGSRGGRGNKSQRDVGDGRPRADVPTPKPTPSAVFESNFPELISAPRTVRDIPGFRYVPAPPPKTEPKGDSGRVVEKQLCPKPPSLPSLPSHRRWQWEANHRKICTRMCKTDDDHYELWMEAYQPHLSNLYSIFCDHAKTSKVNFYDFTGFVYASSFKNIQDVIR